MSWCLAPGHGAFGRGSLERVNLRHLANTRREDRSYLVDMNCGSPVRPPPRRPVVAAGRLASIVCLLLLATALWAGPAGASYASEGDTRSGHVTGTGAESCVPRRRAHRNADPMSFVFFIGIVIAVVLFPVALNKREETPPQ
jgi:hypothetical protein